MTLLTNKILIINAPGIKQKAFIGSPLWNGWIWKVCIGDKKF
jgi:hypothetical protein